MGEIMESARRSRFLADLSPFDRDPWRTAVALPAGLLAAVVGAALGGALALVTALVVVSGLDGAPTTGDLFAIFSDPNLSEPSARQSLFLLTILAGVNLGAAVGFVFAAGAIHHRKLKGYVNDGQPLRWRLLIGGLVLVAIVMSAVVGGAALAGQSIEPPLGRMAPNLAGQVIYRNARCLLHKDAAACLYKASQLARMAGARTVEINLEPTQGARLFDEGVYGPATEAVPGFFADF